MLTGAFGYLADYLLWWVLCLSLLVHAWCFFRFFPPTRSRKARLAVGNALVFACLLAIAALAGESYFRFCAVHTDSFGVSLPARRWFALYTKLNSLGCRDKEWTQGDPPGVRRIAFVGDSYVYGWGIENPSHRFSDLIQAKFNVRNAGEVEVLNVAKPGWNSKQELQPVKDMIERYGVDEIVLGYVPNDIEHLLPRSDDFNPTRPPDSTFFNLDASCLLDYLYRRIYLPRVPTVRGYHDWLAEGFADDQVLGAHQRELDEIIAVCAERGVTFRAVLLPFLKTGGRRFSTPTVHGIMAEYFRSRGAAVVDLAPVLKGVPPDDLVVNAADAHPNERAHALIAETAFAAFYSDPPH
ncbi:MAG: SGNH/GDSL hydrolase family protein [Planctomycetota bacterium]